MSSSTTELDGALLLLKQKFRAEIGRIASQRLKLVKEHSSPPLSPTERNISPVTPSRRPKTDSNALILIQDADGCLVADRSRKDCYRWMQTIRKRQSELDGREALLIAGVKEIEVYLRAIFFLKQETCREYRQLQNVSNQRGQLLQELGQRQKHLERRERFLSKAVDSFESQKLPLMHGSDNVRDLVRQTLVLKEFQQEIMQQQADDDQGRERREVAEQHGTAPTLQTAYEDILLNLQVRLRSVRNEIAAQDEKIDGTVLSQVEDAAAWVEVQKWVRTMGQAIGPYCLQKIDDVDMLDRIKCFVDDMREVMQRLQKS